jgi:chromosome segregation ATPase
LFDFLLCTHFLCYYEAVLFACSVEFNLTSAVVFVPCFTSLLFKVQPGEGNKASFNDMRALSGGERSFSTVCFILSLWSIAESPFRCLDEFDVYMVLLNFKFSDFL